MVESLMLTYVPILNYRSSKEFTSSDHSGSVIWQFADGEVADTISFYGEDQTILESLASRMTQLNRIYCRFSEDNLGIFGMRVARLCRFSSAMLLLLALGLDFMPTERGPL
jgi:hypothetical protein